MTGVASSGQTARTRRRSALRAIVPALALLALCGCSAKSHVSAGLSGQGLIFIDCGDYKANALSVYATPLDERWSDASQVWAATSKSELASKTVVVYGADPVGFADTVGPEAFDPRRSKFEVAFLNSRSASKLPGEVAQFDGLIGMATSSTSLVAMADREPGGEVSIRALRYSTSNGLADS